jgi:hypothetical protein
MKRTDRRFASDDVRHNWRNQIERGWVQAQAGKLVDGPAAMSSLRTRVRVRTKK